MLLSSFSRSLHFSSGFHGVGNSVFTNALRSRIERVSGFASYAKRSDGAAAGSGRSGSDSYKRSIRNIAPQYKPKTANQELYLNYLNDNKFPIVFGIGPAGCGKTLFACITAIKELISGNVQKIVITRPIVAVEEEELGFLPGNLINKMDPWTRPIFDIFLEFYQQKDLDLMLQSGIIEVSPLAYMRGRTFKRCFIIADEMQNSSPNQMLMLTTRIGEKTKMVITGDLKQSDRSTSNGLSDVLGKVRSFYAAERGGASGGGGGIQIVEMDHSDIKRSEIVSHILDVYGADDAEDVVVAEDAVVADEVVVAEDAAVIDEVVVYDSCECDGCISGEGCNGCGEIPFDDVVVEKKPITKKSRYDNSGFLNDCAL